MNCRCREARMNKGKSRRRQSLSGRLFLRYEILICGATGAERNEEELGPGVKGTTCVRGGSAFRKTGHQVPRAPCASSLPQPSNGAYSVWQRLTRMPPIQLRRFSGWWGREIQPPIPKLAERDQSHGTWDSRVSVLLCIFRNSRICCPRLICLANQGNGEEFASGRDFIVRSWMRCVVVHRNWTGGANVFFFSSLFVMEYIMWQYFMSYSEGTRTMLSRVAGNVCEMCEMFWIVKFILRRLFPDFCISIKFVIHIPTLLSRVLREK